MIMARSNEPLWYGPFAAGLMIGALFVILFNLVADVLYGVLDPRIRYV